MFEKARLTLTAWYLVIIMAISLLFSFVIYSNINLEFQRFEKFTEVIQTGDGQVIIPLNHFKGPPRFDPQMIQQARMRLFTVLGLINLVILGVAGAAGYFLAGRTLRPIRHMVEEQNRFITDASHELRTPLTSLRSEIEVGLRNKELTLKDSKELLESNLEEVVSLQTLSDSLLELAQIGKPTNSRVMTTFPLTQSLDAAIKKLNGIVKKKAIKIEKRVGDIKIQAVSERITELFVILLDNAAKYSPAKSTIVVTAKHQDGMVKVMIQDQGIGIANEDLPNIFDRFYRAGKSRSKEKVTGYGLGLSIAQEIVNSHAGSITVTSKLEKGTLVTIILPSEQ